MAKNRSRRTRPGDAPLQASIGQPEPAGRRDLSNRSDSYVVVASSGIDLPAHTGAGMIIAQPFDTVVDWLARSVLSRFELFIRTRGSHRYAGSYWALQRSAVATAR